MVAWNMLPRVAVAACMTVVFEAFRSACGFGTTDHAQADEISLSGIIFGTAIVSLRACSCAVLFSIL